MDVIILPRRLIQMRHPSLRKWWRRRRSRTRRWGELRGLMLEILNRWLLLLSWLGWLRLWSWLLLDWSWLGRCSGGLGYDGSLEGWVALVVRQVLRSSPGPEDKSLLLIWIPLGSRRRLARRRWRSQASIRWRRTSTQIESIKVLLNRGQALDL